MQIKRIELTGDAGDVVIKCDDSGKRIQIDSTTRAPGYEPHWRTILPSGINHEYADLRKVAAIIQQRTDGYEGTDIDVELYFRQINGYALAGIHGKPV